MKNIITLTLPAERAFSRVAAQTATSVAGLVSGENRQEAAGSDFSHAFELAVSEAFTNSVAHAGARADAVTLTFEFDERRLSVSVRDANEPFSIETPAPDIESYPENGYGLWIIRNVMDSVTYRREGNANIIFMSKTL